VGALDGWLSKI
jgi:DDE superfamily endonuclease